MLTRILRGRGALLAVSLICLTVCVGCGSLTTDTNLGPARRVVVALPGPASALYAPLYEALANGDFARGALAVSVSASASPLTQLADGNAMIAIASEPALLAARDAGQQLVAIGALERSPLDAIISLAAKPITRPAQLIGKRVATNGSALATAELTAFLARANIPIARVRTSTPSDLDAALAKRKALAIVGGLWNYDAIALAQAGHPTTAIHVDAVGVPTFTNLAIVVRVGEAHRDGALLRAFLQSLTRGERAVQASPQRAAATLAGFNPGLSKRFELAVLAATAAVSSPGTGQPYGYQNALAWARFGDWMANAGLLHHTPKAGFAVTNEFLPGQGE